MTKRRFTASLVLVFALTAVPAISGCSLVEDSVASGVEDVIKEATGGLDVELSSGLPDGFPEDAVPVIDGDIFGAATTIDEKDAWVVSVSVKDSGAAARDALVDAGFAVDSEVTSKDGTAAQFSGNGYQVSLVVSSESVIYTVVTAT